MARPTMVGLENLIDQVEFHPRFTFDLTHSLLGHPLLPQFLPHIVELHLSGTDGHTDHLPLDAATLEKAVPLLGGELLVCFGIFAVADALGAVDLRPCRSLRL